MKRNIFLNGWIGILAVTLITMGCSKDPVENETPEFEALSFNTDEVMELVPDGLLNSDDVHAQQVVGYINSALDWSSFINEMTPPEDAVQTTMKTVNDNSWSWTNTDGMNTYVWYWSYSEEGDTKYWTMDIKVNDNDPENYIYAWEKKDGSQGAIQYNFNWVSLVEGGNVEPTDLYWTYTWAKLSNGGYNFSWKWDADDSEEYNYLLQHNITVNKDGSGTIDYYLEDVKFYNATWDNAGNGTWTLFDGDNSLSGSWTV